MSLFLRDDLAVLWQGDDPFQRAAQQPGQVYRAREGRRTLQFAGADGHSYFLKYHGGIGWKEILKNLSQFKAPVLGAMAEVRAIHAVAAAGLDTMTLAGYGERGSDPARRESFLVTDDLVDTLSLEQVGESWVAAGHTPLLFKRALIARVAAISRTLHGAGINHRDYYLGHFLMPAAAVAAEDAQAPLYLIDLHRAQVRAKVPARWRVKDLGGLYFSSARYGLTRRDLLRFLKVYTGLPLRQALRQHRWLLAASRREAERVYQRYFEQPAAFPLQYCDEPPGKDS